MTRSPAIPQEPSDSELAEDSAWISSKLTRWTSLILMLVILSITHFATSPHYPWAHDFLFKVTYLPIVLAGLWFGWRGGLLLALLTGIVYVVHIQWQLSAHHDHGGLFLELVLYVVIGMIVGWLSDGQRSARQKLSDANTQLQQSLSALREKTEALLSAEESLRRVDQLRAAGEVAAGLAHEVRNPLGGITGAADIVLNPETSAEARTEFAAVLKKEIKRLDRVITQFLDFARPGGTRDGSVRLHQEIAFVGKLTAGPRGEKGVSFDASQVPEDLWVPMSSDALRQVLLNLTLNALTAAPDRDGRIVWKAAREKDQITVRITDNGSGVDASIRDRLFEPFVTTRDGTGLGLAIVARLVRDVGGNVSLVHTGAQGSAFAVTFPVGDSDRRS